MNTRTVQGYYGSGHTACQIFVYTLANGQNWYVIEGSRNVNCTYEDIELGCDVETLSDHDCFTSKPIETEEDFEAEMEDYLWG